MIGIETSILKELVERNKLFNTNISKRDLWRYVNKKINRSIHYYHVFSIISILFEEMVNELIKNKEIKIFNFGTFTLKKTNPKKYYDVRYQKVMQAPSYQLLKFNISKKIRNKICNNLDIARTFGDD